MEGEKIFRPENGRKEMKNILLKCPDCGKVTGEREIEVGGREDTGHEFHHKTCKECADKIRKQMGLPPAADKEDNE